MANVIVIHYGGMLVKGKYQSLVFYEGLIGALRKNGNNVMEIITNDLLERPWNGSNRLRSIINRSKLIKEIVSFKPDLIISFNNSSIEGLENEVKCPIAVWDADHFYHFNDLDKLRANKGRYVFFCSQSSDIADCQKIIGADPDQCFLVKPATSIRSDVTHEKTNNVLFIGTPFFNNDEKGKFYGHKKAYVELVKEMMRGEESGESLMHKYRGRIPGVDQTILDFGSVPNRANTLAHVAPLGLSIHGGAGWLEIGLDFSLDIFSAYNPERIYSVAQTQEAYNKSKIGLNINHTQAKSGYSWRVMDILASSAVLVSNYSKDLADDLGEELAREVFYSTPQEAYELCKKLLQDESLRMRIVQRSNEIVDKCHTWEVRVGEIENILKMKLVNKQVPEGKYILLDAKEYFLWFFEKLLNARNQEGGNIFIRSYGFLTMLIRFIIPYGIVKFMLLSRKEKRFFLSTGLFFRALNRDNPRQGLMIRII